MSDKFKTEAGKKDWIAMLKDVGGWDNDMQGINAGAVKEMALEIEQDRETVLKLTNEVERRGELLSDAADHIDIRYDHCGCSIHDQCRHCKDGNVLAGKINSHLKSEDK